MHGADALGGVVVRRRPATYEIAACGLTCISDRACVALAEWPGSFVDFEAGELVCVVGRSQPDL